LYPFGAGGGKGPRQTTKGTKFGGEKRFSGREQCFSPPNLVPWGVGGKQRGKQSTEQRQSRSCAPCSMHSNASTLTGQTFGKRMHYWWYAWTKAQMDGPSCGSCCSPSRSAWYFFPTWLTAAPFDQDTYREQQCYMRSPTTTVHIFLFSTVYIFYNIGCFAQVHQQLCTAGRPTQLTIQVHRHIAQSTQSHLRAKNDCTVLVGSNCVSVFRATCLTFQANFQDDTSCILCDHVGICVCMCACAH